MGSPLPLPEKATRWRLWRQSRDMSVRRRLGAVEKDIRAAKWLFLSLLLFLLGKLTWAGIAKLTEAGS